MAHYESDKMIQLIQLCCWKERTEMTQNGLITLATKVASGQEEGRRGEKDALNDRYMVDLLSDARKALKDGGTIVKRESCINLLLRFVGFNDWDAWKAALRTPGNFLSPETGFEITAEKAVTIVIPLLLEKQLNPTLTFVKKSSPIDLLACREETLSELAKHLITQLEKSSMIICALPLSWKDQAVKMRQSAWGEFSRTGRILPVWIDADGEWNPVAPVLPSVKQEQATAGLPGVLMGLLFLENYAMAEANATEQGSGASQGSRENAPQFNNSSVGIYMQGGTVHNLSAGDQTINNYID